MAEPARDINSSRPFHRTAQAWLDKGHLPFPLKPKGKNPLEKDAYTGKKNPFPKAPQAFVDAQLAKAPQKANIGIWVGPDVICLDIDDYVKDEGTDKEKRYVGFAEYEKLAEELGPLPDTYITTARADGKSGIRWYRLPEKYINRETLNNTINFSGKASSNIDVVHRGYRFAVVGPSIHPETDSPYRTYAPGVAPDGKSFEPTDPFSVHDLPFLPESWIKFLSKDYTEYSDVDMDMSMQSDKIVDWYKDRMPKGKACSQVKKSVKYALKELSERADGHEVLTAADWNILNLGAEGHPGAYAGAVHFEKHYFESMVKRGKRSPSEVKREIFRSRTNAIRKIKATVDRMDAEGVDSVGTSCTCIELSDSEGSGDSPVASYIALAPTGTLHDPTEYGTTDTGNAEHLWDLTSKGNLIWVTGHERFILWNGERWHIDNSENRLTINCYRRMNERQAKWLQAMLEVARKQTDEAEAKKLYAQAKAWGNFVNSSADLPRLERCLKRYHNINLESSIEGVQLDGNNYLLGMANGVIDFTTNPPSFRQARKSDYVMLNTEIDFWPEGLRDIKEKIGEDQDLFLGWKYWNSYLDTFLPEPELRHFTQKILGTVLTGVNEERIMIFLKGKTGSGKSTMLSAIMDALGEYSGVISYDAFNKKDDANPSMVDALSKRLLTFSEMGDSVKIDAEVLKRIAGGSDPIKVRKLYSSSMIEKVFGGTVVVGTNSSPEIKNYDKALDARLCVIPFDHQIMKNGDRTKMNTGMPELLKRYARPIIFHWLYEGYLMYRREGISRNEWPELVELATADFSDDVSDFGLFIKECIVPVDFDGTDFESRDRTAIAADSAYKRYKKWVQKHDPDGNDDYALGPRQFNKKMDSNGFQKKRIRLHPETESKAASYAFLGCQFLETATTVQFKDGS
ncbi:DNA primase/polymerase [Gordonia phage LuckyLeo]|nr:DNA primase/polymerase [Gordonia phage LuckyLeo]